MVEDRGTTSTTTQKEAKEMSKPSQVQLDLIKIISNELTCWAASNDIHSPSHFGDLESELGNYFMDSPVPLGAQDKIQRGLAMVLDGIMGASECAFRSAVVDRLNPGGNPDPDGSKAN